MLSKFRFASQSVRIFYIFVLTIILSLFLAFMFYEFYNNYNHQVRVYSILGDVNSAIHKLEDLDICASESENISISYSAIENIYTLDCILQKDNQGEYEIKNLGKVDIKEISDDYVKYSLY